MFFAPDGRVRRSILAGVDQAIRAKGSESKACVVPLNRRNLSGRLTRPEDDNVRDDLGMLGVVSHLV